MSKNQPIELFMPPNTLKAKAGGSGFDMLALKRAEGAVETLKSEFQEWMGDDVAKLCERRDLFAADPSSSQRASDLFRASIDLKGQAATFDYPLIARTASSLCKLIEETNGAPLPLPLVDAHVAAVRALFRDGIKDAADTVALVLVEELEARTADAIKSAQ